MEETKEQPEKQKIIRFGGKQRQRGSCWFCDNELLIDYKDIEVLRSFLSPRGKILSRKISGTCAKHQRSLARAIKNARQLALLR